jgi:putative resolvase
MNPQEAAASPGISVKTRSRWDKAGKLHAARTPGKRRRIARSEIQQLQGQREAVARCAWYAQVSTFKQLQEGTLARQLEQLRIATAKRDYQGVQAITECDSSLNEKRRGMHKQHALVKTQAVDVVLIEHPERLVRFAFSDLEGAFGWCHVRLEVLDQPTSKDATHEVLAALLTIVTDFSGKLYAYRAHANPRRRKVLSLLPQREQEERSA